MLQCLKVLFKSSVIHIDVITVIREYGSCCILNKKGFGVLQYQPLQFKMVEDRSRRGTACR
jgi:hypothetical protein